MTLLKKTIFSLLLFGGAYFFSSITFKKKSNFTSLKNENRFTITVIIQNIRNKNGCIQLDLYKNQTEYEARTSDKKRRAYVYKNKMVNGTVTYEYTDLPGDVYGIALFDDENNSGKIDYGWLMPTEGFGFGDYWHTKWSAPHFDNFKFTLKSNKTITVKVKYL
jgi:uncharacterized protein (DUF2141 family)